MSKASARNYKKTQQRQNAKSKAAKEAAKLPRKPAIPEADPDASQPAAPSQANLLDKLAIYQAINNGVVVVRIPYLGRGGSRAGNHCGCRSRRQASSFSI